MSNKSSGILLYSQAKGFLEVLLVHPAVGPNFFPGDNGWWSIPKGQFDTEEPLEAGIREFQEEVGIEIKVDNYIELTPVLQKNGKTVYAFAVEMELDVSNSKSNSFIAEYPPNSGIMVEYLEVDKAEWFDVKTAKVKLGTQRKFIDELVNILNKNKYGN